MPKIVSQNFGTIEYAPGEPFVFPDGLPGFPLETGFLPVEVPDQLPLLYLQSLRRCDLCFVALPVGCIVGSYELAAGADDLVRIGLSPDTQPGSQMLCLALVCFAEDGTATANLRAPVIVNLENRMAAQTIQSEDRYPIRYVLQPAREGAMC
jgi:flagellar assembly factor FliW